MPFSGRVREIFGKATENIEFGRKKYRENSSSNGKKCEKLIFSPEILNVRAAKKSLIWKIFEFPPFFVHKQKKTQFQKFLEFPPLAIPPSFGALDPPLLAARSFN